MKPASHLATTATAPPTFPMATPPANPATARTAPPPVLAMKPGGITTKNTRKPSHKPAATPPIPATPAARQSTITPAP
ncbi:MAG: hypothetical protein B7Y73_08620 [Acidocella sp. 35-58-6]|nr:MAG: hypothetical protein B7Y73_08620 [Acidocella sp. 35-58-6]